MCFYWKNIYDLNKPTRTFCNDLDNRVFTDMSKLQFFSLNVKPRDRVNFPCLTFLKIILTPKLLE